MAEAPPQKPEITNTGAVARDGVAGPAGLTRVASDLHPIPGSELVGRGLKLFPRMPYMLKDFLVERDTAPPSMVSAADAHAPVCTAAGVFLCPASLAVQESPPVHQGESLGKTVIYDSSDKLDSLYSINRKIAAGFGPFSISAGSDYSKSVTSSTESRFAVRTSFIPLWAVYMPSPVLGPNFQDLLENLNTSDLVAEPAKSSRDIVTARKNYFASLFEKFGTHYVTRAWVGGKATVNIIVKTSSGVSKRELENALSVSWTGSGSLNQKDNETRSKVLKNSEVVIWGEGGDTPLLAKLANLDDATYNAWLDSVVKNPQVIELEVKGIWTLFSDPEYRHFAESMKNAYEKATEFSPIRAMVTVDWEPPKDKKGNAPRAEKILYVIRKGSRYAIDLFDVSKRPSKEPLYGHRDCPLHSDSFFRPVDAAVNLPAAPDLTWPNRQNLLYFFSGGNCLVYDPSEPRVMLAAGSAESPPKRTSEKGKDVVEYLDFVKKPVAIDEVMATVGLKDRGVIDTLIRNKVVVLQKATGLVQDVAPIATFFDLPFARVDAAFDANQESGKAYFFYLSQYVRFDIKKWQVDEGYPQKISDRWDGVPFDRIDAALRLHEEVYLFRKDAYVVYSLETRTVDPGYPRYVVGSHLEDWEIFG